MKRADIKIGYMCNNQCLFCVQGDRRKTLGNKPGSEIQKAIALAKEQHCDALVFTGGEATLREDFLELVAYARALGFKNIQVQTNGRMFSYLDFCKKTIAAGATEFSPALHGPTAEIHDHLTGAPGSFDQTTRGIRNLKALGQPVITNTVITKENYRSLPDLARLFVALQVDQFQFAFVHIAGSAEANREQVVPRKTEVMPFVKAGLDIGIAAGIRVMTEAIPYCLMKGYEQYVAERVIPDGMVIEYERTIEDYSAYRSTIGKTKGPRCKVCACYDGCEGPWREYPELFGWDEFVPIPKRNASARKKRTSVCKK